MSALLRRELLDLLAELSALHPNWRFGQLVENVAMWAKGPGAEAIWDVEDEELLQAIKRHLAEQTITPGPG
jgi:hypothetical protein